MAECGGLLNHPRLFRFSHFNHLQLGRDQPSRANVLSLGCKCSPLCSPAKRAARLIQQLLSPLPALCSNFPRRKDLKP